MGKKRRYVWGIYLLLGEKPEQLLKIYMINNAVFVLIMLITSLLSNAYIMKLEPKEILTQTKE